jgi:hypothetical protein
MSVPSNGQRPRWPTLGPLMAGIIFSVLASFWAPWEMVHPVDASLRQALGYAPLWSHRFAGTQGAQVDWTAFSINLAVIWVVCLAAILMLNMSAQHE